MAAHPLSRANCPPSGALSLGYLPDVSGLTSEESLTQDRCVPMGLSDQGRSRCYFEADGTLPADPVTPLLRR
jgi:hypothetical protein